MKVNYDLRFCRELDKIKSSEKKPKLLLHCCCAPCASSVIPQLTEYFDLTAFYYNPNITDFDEYRLRYDVLVKLVEIYNAKIYSGDLLGGKIKLINGEYNTEDFFAVALPFAAEREGGLRCAKCFELRLMNTAKFAKANNFDYFATTLTVSPHKDSQVLNEIGLKIGQELAVNYLPSDFKKREGYKQSIILSQEFGLYRQNFCGCEFSKTQN